MNQQPEVEVRELVSIRPGQWKTARYKARVLAMELAELASTGTETTFTAEELKAIAALLQELSA
jgi:hypothetical protein